MAYRRSNRTRRAPARGRGRSGARRPAVRSRRRVTRSRSVSRKPQTIRIEVVQSSQAGDFQGGGAMPQITTQTRKARF